MALYVGSSDRLLYLVLPPDAALLDLDKAIQDFVDVLAKINVFAGGALQEFIGYTIYAKVGQQSIGYKDMSTTNFPPPPLLYSSTNSLSLSKL